MKAGRKAIPSVVPTQVIKKRRLYQPGWSVKLNENCSWSIWWKTPERLPDGSVAYRTHGKVIAPKGSTKQEAERRAKRFISGVKVPHMEHAEVEKTRKQVEAILAKQRRDAERLATRPKKPEAPRMGNLAFTPPAVYLLDSAACSQRVLGEYLVSRMGEAASLRKGIAQMQVRLTECEAETLFGSWLIRNRQTLLDSFKRQARATDKVPTVPKRSQELLSDLAQRLLGTPK